MTPDRYRHIGELYHAALEMAPDHRAEFLRTACQGDDALRADVESLLRAHVDAKDLFEAPAVTSPGHLPAHVLPATIGPYRILEVLGIGGMGEVYRAEDPRLGRQVAVKVLPSRFATDAQHVARFEREARLLASLNHPNVASLYGIEEFAGGRALIMELVEGTTLAHRLVSGPVGLDEAMAIACQIADALEVAHEHGIIHRDLKPGNIAIRPDGTVKVLDFGLARTHGPQAGTAVDLTRTTTVLGTVGYMSPEQARGERVDQRTDIWAFGCVLFEMITGRQPFAGTTASDVIASVLTATPDYSLLPASVPGRVRRLLRRCLDKNPRQRLRHIGDARFDLQDAVTPDDRVDEARSADAAPSVAALPKPRRLLLSAAALLFVAVGSGVGVWMAGRRAVAAPQPAVRAVLASLRAATTAPIGERHLAISSDGARVAYTPADQLWIRRIDETDAITIAGYAGSPFFSPDGEWVGFFGAANALRKVSVHGGAPVTVATSPGRAYGAAWGADGTIVFATGEGLFEVPENGGAVRLLRKPDPRQGERLFAWPHVLPDGRSVVFTVIPEGTGSDGKLALLDRRSAEARVVVQHGSTPHYTSNGDLVYSAAGTLSAVKFDAAAGRAIGEPVAFGDIRVATAGDDGAADFAIADNGTLVYLGPEVPGSSLQVSWVWADRHGHETPLGIPASRAVYARVSPDSRLIALDIPGTNRDIWIWDVGRSSMSRLTSNATEEVMPTWRPDGRLFFASQRSGNFDIYSQAPDGATAERLEFAAPGDQTPTGFTPDGMQLIVNENFKDVSVVFLTEPRRLDPLLHTDFNEWIGVVSPDGRWIAYESNEAGSQVEIFLRPYPGVAARREKVSINGGRFPSWNPNASGELFYVDPSGAMMAAAITLSPALVVGRVTRLFDGPPPPSGIAGRRYDVTADGRFLLSKPVTGAPSPTRDIAVIVNWFPELRPRTAGAR